MRQERGQAMVLLVLAMVGMLGFSALALDGGILYTERRRAQNTADNAALAGALKAALTASDSNGISEARTVATANGYTNGVGGVVVNVNKPPTSGTYAGNSLYLEVTITQPVGTSFMHLVWPGQVALTVRAVAKAEPSTYTPLVEGQALVALSEEDCDALWFTGSGDTTVTGGGAFSNSNCVDSAGRRSGAANVVVSSGGVNVVGGWEDNGGGGSVSPAPTTGVAPLDPMPAFGDPPCDHASMQARGAYSQNGGTAAISPGRYDSIAVGANGTTYMGAGLYCLYGDFDARSGSLIGGGVLIYMDSGSFQTNAGASNNLSAPTDATCGTTSPDLCDFTGLLVYVAEDNDDAVQISGNATTSFTGTIFAPASECTLTGNSGNVGLSSQVMCDTIKIAGSAVITIDYDPGENFDARKPPDIELTE